MQAVVLAAGRGSRLGSLTDDRPKTLVEVGGRPILARLLDTLASVDVDEVVVVVGYGEDAVRERCGDAHRGVDLTYVHQAERRGPAHALLTAEPHVGDEDFLVVHGDYVFGDADDLRRVIECHRDRGPVATVLVETVSTEVARGFGVCAFDDEGRLSGMVQQPADPPSNVVVTGCFAFAHEIFDACRLVTPSHRDEYELSDAIDLLVHAGRPVELVDTEGWHVNVNTAEDRQRAERLIQEEE